jgi:hypothetical protein
MAGVQGSRAGGWAGRRGGGGGGGPGPIHCALYELGGVL